MKRTVARSSANLLLSQQATRLRSLANLRRPLALHEPKAPQVQFLTQTSLEDDPKELQAFVQLHCYRRQSLAFRGEPIVAPRHRSPPSIFWRRPTVECHPLS